MSQDSFTLALPESMDIANAQALQQSLLEALNQEQAIDVDGAAVSRCDAAGLQLLLAFVRALGGQQWAWNKVSSCLQDGAHGLGLATKLHIGPTT